MSAVTLPNERPSREMSGPVMGMILFVASDISVRFTMLLIAVLSRLGSKPRLPR